LFLQLVGAQEFGELLVVSEAFGDGALGLDFAGEFFESGDFAHGVFLLEGGLRP
jgi:hypothetical protein